jgi:hypothetical protein
MVTVKVETANVDGRKNAASQGVADLTLRLGSITAMIEWSRWQPYLRHSDTNRSGTSMRPAQNDARESVVFRETSDTMRHYWREFPTDLIRCAIALAASFGSVLSSGG